MRSVGLVGVLLANIGATALAQSSAEPAIAQASGTLTIKVTPASRDVQLASKAVFKAALAGPGAKDGVEWLIAGVVGGNDSVGRIVANGNSGTYTAPSAASLPMSVQITARAKANSVVTASAAVRLLLPPPTVSAILPPKIATGFAGIRIEGAYFTAGSRVKLGKLELTTQVLSPNLIYAGTRVPSNSPPSAPLVVYDSAVTNRKSAPKNVQIIRNDPKGLDVADSSLSLRAGQEYRFHAAYLGMPLDQAQWFVNGKLWGDATYGYIDNYGRYRSPYVQPAATTVEILAKSMDRTPKVGRAVVSILPPIPTIRATYPMAIRPTGSNLTVRGFGFLTGATALVNGVATPTTFYGNDALGVPISVTRPASRRIYVQIENPAPSGLKSNVVEVYVLSDPNSTGYLVDDQSAQRFLDQATFGPDDAGRDRVRELGYSSWIDEQMGTTESLYPALPANMSDMQEDFAARTFARNMLRAPDQLRQRMLFALGQLFVVSDARIRDEGAVLEWQRMMSRNAFGNFRDLLTLVSLSPVMGRYLDLANSEKANSDGSVVPNENYAREVMQLFSVGLVQLNRDGTPRLDAQGNTIPTYTQHTVTELSRAFTGWGYPRDPARAFTWPTPERYIGQMEPFETVHDTGAKTLMNGFTIPAGGTVRSDLDAALNHIFAHPNVPPFIATRLIRHFVKSNPSPAYVDRVASVFENNGRGVRGDLKSVLKAVLMDSEARTASGSLSDGKLREPILHLTAILRALQAQPVANAEYEFATQRVMGQKLLGSPTVFNFFSPMNRVGTGGLFGPEFQIYTPVMAVNRSNLIFHFLNGRYDDDIPLLLDPYQSLANDPTRLVDRVNTDFFRGRMSSALRNELIDTVSRQTSDPQRRAMSALWLAVTSGEYAVQH